MKIRNKDKSNKDLKMNKMKLNYEVMNLANDINKNYHGWL